MENYVKYFYYFHSDSIQPEKIIPMGTSEITIMVDSCDRDIYLANMRTKSYMVTPKALKRVVGVCLYPWALNSLFNIPQTEISDNKLPLSDIANAHYKTLTGKLKGVNNYLDIVKVMERYLVGIQNSRPNPLMVDAVNFIRQHNGRTDIQQLYKRYNISERRLQQLFNSSIGMSPKKYCLLKKFHFTVTQLKPDSNLTRLALDLGYYDQAHFINEFKLFADICPSGFLKEKNGLNRINAGTYLGN